MSEYNIFGSVLFVHYRGYCREVSGLQICFGPKYIFFQIDNLAIAMNTRIYLPTTPSSSWTPLYCNKQDSHCYIDKFCVMYLDDVRWNAARVLSVSLSFSSDVRRSSRIPVQWFIRFDWQILPAYCNSTGFRSIGLQRQLDPTGSGSDLNIIQSDLTDFGHL